MSFARAIANKRVPPPLVRSSWEAASPAHARPPDAPPSLAARRRGTSGLERVVLKFTTLSNDAPARGFVVDAGGATVGRGDGNTIRVGSDGTMALRADRRPRCRS